MGHKKVGVPSRRYTSEFKIEAVKLGHSVGMSEASRRLGIPDSSLFNWVRLERKGKLGTSAGIAQRRDRRRSWRPKSIDCAASWLQPR
jgi:transposase